MKNKHLKWRQNMIMSGAILLTIYFKTTLVKIKFLKRMVGITEVLFALISSPGWRNEAKQTQSLLRRTESAEKQFCNDQNARSARRVLPHPFSFYPGDLSRSAWIIYTDLRDSKSNSCFFFYINVYIFFHTRRWEYFENKKIK